MTQPKQVLEFEYSQARTISRKLRYYDPEGNEVIKTHFLFILLKNLPANIPTTPNPRQPDPDAKPCKQMRETLEIEPEYFTDCNRGLFLSAEKVIFPNSDKGERKVIIDFGADEDGNPKGGLVDGGHSYAVLKNKMDDEALSDLPIFVTIIEGADQFATKLARARNTSVQVAEKSIANLERKFEGIKKALGKYSDKIIYFENENKGDDAATFPIEEITALMTALNKDLYDNNHQPTIAYTGVTSCFNKWMNDANRPTYEKLYSILPSIVELYEYLYLNFEDFAVQSKIVKRAGNWNGIETHRGKGKKRKAVNIRLPFTSQLARYKLSKGFSMPVFAALRFLLEEKNGQYDWAVDPKVFLKKHGATFVGQVLEAHQREYGSNPNKTGKSRVLWQNIANTVVIHSLQEKLAQK
ncbi:MAG: AIPR family protein [Patescibacteria group bacterium]|jgi:hypothetical protein